MQRGKILAAEFAFCLVLIVLLAGLTIAEPLGWGDDTRITNNPASSTFPSLAIDNIDDADIVWEENRDGNPEIYFAKRNVNGQLLIGDKRVTVNASQSKVPKIAVDANRDIHVV